MKASFLLFHVCLNTILFWPRFFQVVSCIFPWVCAKFCAHRNEKNEYNINKKAHVLYGVDMCRHNEKFLCAICVSCAVRLEKSVHIVINKVPFLHCSQLGTSFNPQWDDKKWLLLSCTAFSCCKTSKLRRTGHDGAVRYLSREPSSIRTDWETSCTPPITSFKHFLSFLAKSETQLLTLLISLYVST